MLLARKRCCQLFVWPFRLRSIAIRVNRTEINGRVNKLTYFVFIVQTFLVIVDQGFGQAFAKVFLLALDPQGNFCQGCMPLCKDEEFSKTVGPPEPVICFIPFLQSSRCFIDHYCLQSNHATYPLVSRKIFSPLGR